MKTNMLPIELLKEYLFYDAKTGEFYWIKSPAPRIKAGSKAGYKHKGKYTRIRLLGARIFAHRVAWAMIYGEWPIDEIDHIHGYEAGNGILNLRLATKQQNQFNRKSCNRHSSRFKGVSWNPRDCVWIAQARLNGKAHRLGRFKDEAAAAQAYLEFAKTHHGEYLHLPSVHAMR